MPTLTLPRSPASFSPEACRPRWATPRTDRPTYGGRAAVAAVKLGMPLMPWQQEAADIALEYDPDTGRLVYREVTLTVPRQSGKTTLILALAMERAFSWGAPQNITYAAQTRKDARQKWEDDQLPILQKSAFAKHFRARKTFGSEAFIFRNRSKYGLIAPTKKSGHGPTIDQGFIDEAFSQPDARLEQAFKPSMITRPSAQLYVVSTAGESEAESPYLWSKVQAGRTRAEMGLTSRVAYIEYSAPDDSDPGDPLTWYSCMPALGIIRADGAGVTEDAIAAEFESMELREFRRAYLNQWVDAFPDEWLVISQDDWLACSDPASPRPRPRVVIAADAAPDQASGAIAIAGRRPDGRMVVEIPSDDHRPGVSWIVPRLLELKAKHRPSAVIIDPGGPAAGLIDEAVRAGIEVTKPGANDVAQAFAQFYAGIAERSIVHLGQAELANALKGATRRQVGDGGFAWARKNTSVDISPLVAATNAAWAYGRFGRNYDLLRSVAPPT